MSRITRTALALVSLVASAQLVGPLPAHAERPTPKPRPDIGRPSTPAQTQARQVPGPKGAKTRVFDTGDSPFDPTSANQGWWAVGIDAGFANANYLVGVCCPNGDHRNFFTFDLRKLRKTVESATLRINTHDVVGDETETVRLSDVSTDAATLNHNSGQNAEIFNDLGTGTVYGEYVIGTDQDNVTLDLKLNSAAVADINQARGGFFSIGGSLVSLSGEGGFREEFVFGGSGNTSDDTVQLVTTIKRGR